MRNPIRAKVGTELSIATAKQRLNITEIAAAIGIKGKTFSTYKTNYREMPAETAVQTADYLKDSKFNSEMSSKFFNTIKIFSTHMWAKQNQENAFAILEAQRIEERERMELDYEVIKAMLMAKDTKKAKDYITQLLEEIAVEQLYAYELSELFEIDLVELTIRHNRAC